MFTVELQTYSCLMELLYRLQQDSHHTHTHTLVMSEVRALPLDWQGGRRRHGSAICFVFVWIERRLTSVANADVYFA